MVCIVVDGKLIGVLVLDVLICVWFFDFFLFFLSVMIVLGVGG